MGKDTLTVTESNGLVEQTSSPLRRDVANRSPLVVQPYENDDIDLEGGKLEKDKEKTKGNNKVIKVMRGEREEIARQHKEIAKKQEEISKQQEEMSKQQDEMREQIQLLMSMLKGQQPNTECPPKPTY